jgi:hypothetical protein
MRVGWVFQGRLDNAAEVLLDQAEKLKADIQAKVEQPFQVVKRQFGYVKVRYRDLKKNTAQLRHTVCAVQFVDSARQVDGDARMSAPKTWEKALQSVKTALLGKESSADWDNCS